MRKVEFLILSILSSSVVTGVQVVEEPGAVPVGALNQIFGFFSKAWKWMLVAVIIFILGIVIYYLFKKLDDERKERDEPGYQVYKAIKKTCLMQADKRRIRKSWSLVNLLWFGFPIIKKEHSCKFLDVSNRILGYYRGESHSMDNSINYLVYKSKYFIFFEESFVIKVPRILKFKRKDVRTGEEKPEVINLMHLIKELPNGDFKIYCTGLERLGLYYYCPVFIIDDKHGVLDYRKVMEGAIVDTTYQAMVQRIVNVQARMMEKATLTNPQLQYQRLGGEKTKEEQKLERDIS